MLTEKLCPRCKETKPAIEFGTCRSYITGLAVYCKACVTAYQSSEEAKSRRAQKRAEYRKDPKFLAWDQAPAGMKTCRFGCNQVLPVERFGRCRTYADGLNQTCKECLKKKNSTPERKMAKKLNDSKYSKTELGRAAAKRMREKRKTTPVGIAAGRRGTAKHKKKYPEKNRARVLVGNAIADGRLTKQPCEVCGDQKSQAHHEDYSKPLDVMWLCHKHHIALHRAKIDSAKAHN